MANRWWIIMFACALALAMGANAAVCPLPQDPLALLGVIFPLVDANGDGGLSPAEADLLYPGVSTYWSYVSFLDANRDGKLSPAELSVALQMLGTDPLSLIDANGDRAIQYAEVASYVTAAQFALVDVNGDGVVDCADLGGNSDPGSGTDPEPEPEPEPEPVEPCPIPDLYAAAIDLLLQLLDVDGSGGLSLAEIAAVYPDVNQYAAYFGILDSNRNGQVDPAELQAIVPLLASVVGADPAAMIDPNGDGIIEYAEVASMVTPEQFALVDRNGDGMVDCRDLGETPEPDPDPEPDPEPETPCPLPDLYAAVANLAVRFLDTNGDGGVSLQEIAVIYPDINQYATYFTLADANRDGRIDATELVVLRPLLSSVLGMDPVAYVDPNGDGLIAWEEVSSLVDASIFNFLDRNGNGVIDCEDLDLLITPPTPVDPGDPGDPAEGCPLPDVMGVIGYLAPRFLDANQDGGISLSEIAAVYPAIEQYTGYFNVLDANRDGKLDATELAALQSVLSGVLHENVLPYVDPNGDGIISYEEVSWFVSPGIFALVDVNGDGVFDCEDLAALEPPVVVDPPAPGDPCPLPVDQVIAYLVFVADTNKDGKICLDEVMAVLPPVTIMGADLVMPAVYPSPRDLLTSVFNFVDVNQDGCVDATELQAVLATVDVNGDLVITPGEIPVPGVFAYLDRNGDGVVDCQDVAGLTTPGDGGEGDGGGTGDNGGGEGGDGGGDPVTPPVIGPVPVDMARLLGRLFTAADANGNGALEFSEILAVVNVPAAVLESLDLNHDGAIDTSEAGAVLATAAAGNVEQVLQVLREVRGAYAGRFYRPGESVEVIIRITRRLAREIQGLSLDEVLPDGWTLGTVTDSSGKAVVAKADGNRLRLNWPADVTFPIEVRYTMLAPAVTGARFALVGEVLYNVASSLLSESVPAAVIAEALDPGLCHTADTDRDWRISLSEVLRVVQLFNSGAYGVAGSSEDGFLPGGTDHNGSPHRGDLNGNWQFELSELLRLVQLYNTDNGWYYAGSGTEDGFLAGLL